MKIDQKLDLSRYDVTYIETFLDNYQIFIDSATELAALWDEMDEEEQTLQRAAVMSDWEKRYLLGALYRAGRLTVDQRLRLADLDRDLLAAAHAVEVAYGPPLRDLMAKLLNWGTPLRESKGDIQLTLPAHTLPAIAQALAHET